MKTKLLLICVLYIVNANAQDTKKCEKNFSSQAIKKVSLLSDLIPQIPIECVELEYTVSIMQNGILSEMQCIGKNLSNEVQQKLSVAKSGDKIYIEKIKSVCFDSSINGCKSNAGDGYFFVIKVIN